MAKRSEVPRFGALQTVRAVCFANGIAAPYCAEIMAEMGADVIWIEKPSEPDSLREGNGLAAEAERRNMRSLALDVTISEGKDIFFELIKETDMVIESSPVGEFTKMGFSDETLWEVNPKLVIAHISPYGQTGDPDYVKAPIESDLVAQAFGCLSWINGYQDRDPIPSQYQTSDYYSAFFALAGGIAAIMNARKTGKGESIDIAAYETVFRPSAQKVMDYLNTGKVPWREGNRNSMTTGWGIYPCGDGNFIQTLFLGGTVMKNGLPLLGLEFGSEEYPATEIHALITTPAGKKMEKALLEFCAARTAEQCQAEFMAAGVPASLVMTYDQASHHPHYIARETFTEWENVDGKKIKGPNIFPVFQRETGRIWRGCPSLGMDSVDILEELGKTPEQISTLIDKGVIIGK